MAQKYVIAGDLGTSGVKIVALGTSKQVLASTTESYRLFADGLCAEQEPEEFWQAICRGVQVLQQAGLAAGDCIGIVFGTQWRGLIPVDREGHVLRRAIIWMDKRAGEEAQKLNRAFHEDIFCGMDYWPKLMWFREHEPELYKKAAYIFEPNSFLKWKATGLAYSDITNNYARACHGERNAFYKKILEESGVDQEKFPPLCESSQQVGVLTEAAASQLHLPAGVPVFGGCCDIPAVAIGTGCSRPGALHAYLGTSGWLGYIEPISPTEAYCPSLNEEYDVGFYTMGISVGPSTDWMLRTFFAAEKEKYGSDIWSYLDEALDAIPAGSDRLLVAPWFFGGRPPLSSNIARGVFANLSSCHTPLHMLKALFEGYCYILRQRLEYLRDKSKDLPHAITVCGGGAMNRHWMQAMADILQIEICVPENAQSIGSIGVGYCALVGLGIVDSFDSIEEQMRYTAVYRPDPRHFAEYELLYHQFTQLFGQLSRTFEVLNS